MGQTPEQKYHERVAKIRSNYRLPDEALVAPGNVCWGAYFDGVIVTKIGVGLKPEAVLLQNVTEIKFRPAGVIRGGVLKLVMAGGTPKTIDLSFLSEEEPAFAHYKAVIEAEQQRGIMGVLPPELAARTPPPTFGIDDQKFRTKYNIPTDAVLARSTGNGYISFDGHFVTIQHIGMLRGLVGKSIKRFPITAISNIQIKPAGWVVSGFMQVTAGGSNETKSKFGHQTWDATSDENSIVFTTEEQPAFLALRDAIEEAQRNLHAPKQAGRPAQPAHQEDVLAQLEKLGRLRDTGIVTEEEFAAKKAELLGRL